MGYNLVRLRWAYRILRAKYFVVSTDKASVLVLDAVDPHRESNRLSLEAQSQELTMFLESLTKFIKDHEKAVKKILGRKYAPGVKDSESTERHR